MAPLDYKYFLATRLLMPFQRRKKVDWFRDQYTIECRRLNCECPSVVAHSFGSYLVAEALRKYPELRIHRAIFCGSIVGRDFPWKAISDRGQVDRVLNQYGRRDVWARLAEWFVRDAGQSGLHGFKYLNGVVVEQENPQFSHCNYFYHLNFEKNWVPFLQGTEVESTPVAPPPEVHWRYRLVKLVLCLAAMAAAIFGGLLFLPSRSRAPREVPARATFRQVELPNYGRPAGPIATTNIPADPTHPSEHPPLPRPKHPVTPNSRSEDRRYGVLSECDGYNGVDAEPTEDIGCAPNDPGGSARWEYSRFSLVPSPSDGWVCLQIVRHIQQKAAGQQEIPAAVLWKRQRERWTCIAVKEPAPPRTP